jgi:hypothetical protein
VIPLSVGHCISIHNQSNNYFFSEISKSMLPDRAKTRTPKLDQQLLGRDGCPSARRLGQEDLAQHGRHHGAQEEEEVAVGSNGKAPKGARRKKFCGKTLLLNVEAKYSLMKNQMSIK